MSRKKIENYFCELLVLHLGILVMWLHLHHLVRKVGKRGQKEGVISPQVRRGAEGSLGGGGTMTALGWPGPGLHGH